MRIHSCRLPSLITLLCLISVVTGCESADPHLTYALAAATTPGSRSSPLPVKVALPMSLPTTSPRTSPPTVSISAIEKKCDDTNPQEICLGLKVVVYEDGVLDEVTGKKKTIANIAGVNKIWDQCNISFYLQNYLLVNPSRYGLKRRTADYKQLQEIRSVFQPTLHQHKDLLLVVTDNWSRRESLGSTRANAWTNLPGETLLGAVFERCVGDDITMIAHELGHYLSLDHQDHWSDLMNPLIFESSRGLDQNECAAARWAARNYFTVPEA